MKTIKNTTQTYNDVSYGSMEI